MQKILIIEDDEKLRKELETKKNKNVSPKLKKKETNCKLQK